MRCLHPRTIKNPKVWYECRIFEDGYLSPTGDLLPATIQVPCGKCIACEQNKRATWAARMEKESQFFDTYFVTLTYNEECCPDQLVKKDLQDFFKRLRKFLKIRYFACGEYGDRFGRPHYHFIGFCCKGSCTPDQFSDFVNRSWQKGFIKVDPASLDRFRYVAKYICKSFFYPFVVQDKQPPFALMSRRPGIGLKWLESSFAYNLDFLTLSDGSKIGTPRYFLDKMDPVLSTRIRTDKLLNSVRTESFYRRLYGSNYENLKSLAAINYEETQFSILRKKYYGKSDSN